MFEQFETGDLLVERSPDLPASRMRGYVNLPPFTRLVAGTGSWTDALFHRLDWVASAP